MTDEAVLQALKNENEEGLRAVYHRYRTSCQRYLLARVVHPSVPQREELAGDLFTESLIVLVDNVRSGRLTELSARLDTYLNAVARNLYRQHQRRGRREALFAPEALPAPLVEDDAARTQVQTDEEIQLLHANINKLGGRCRSLLVHFYFLKLDWKTIAEILKYKNAESAKTNKAKCMVRLRKLYGLSPANARKKVIAK